LVSGSETSELPQAVANLAARAASKSDFKTGLIGFMLKPANSKDHAERPYRRNPAGCADRHEEVQSVGMTGGGESAGAIRTLRSRSEF
jgi:hypothetical protein